MKLAVTESLIAHTDFFDIRLRLYLAMMLSGTNQICINKKTCQQTKGQEDKSFARSHKKTRG